jgi:formate dehydrogenase major subunit
MLCVKGRYGLDFVHSEERLRSPLVRRNGVLRPSSWDEALSIVSEGLARARDHAGPGSVAGLSSAKCTNEENYLFQKLFRQVLGSNSVDHCARLCHSSTVTGLGQAIGSAAMSNDIAGIPDAEVILVTGSDTTAAHPVIASRILQAVRAGRTRLIVIDPRRPRLADEAHLYAQPRCGTDVALINGLIHIIISNGWEDRTFIEERCTGFPELRSLVARYDPATVEGITGVPSSLLEEIAALFGQAGTASVFYAMGITQHTTGTDNVRSLANLQLLCGNLGLAGGGINPLRGQCNVQGACDMGALPASLPGYASLDSIADAARFEESWGTPLPTATGLTAMEIVDAAFQGDLKALYIMGENPCLSDPDISHVRRALEKLDFLVVQDIFLTETAHLAHVVLPAACFAEKDGLFTSTERRVQRVRKALDPPGEAREDWRIVTEVARRLGKDWNYRSAEEIQDEIRQLVPAYRGIDWERAGEGGVQWPCPADDHPGTAILHSEVFPIGRGRMKGAHFRPPQEEPDEAFPFVLTTGRLLPHFHTGTMTRKSSGLDELAGPAVEIAPGDAADLGIADGDMVELSTRRGTLSAPASLTDRLPRGTLFMAFHFAEAAANLLTNPARDPQSGIPEFKACAAALRKGPQRLPRPQT